MTLNLQIGHAAAAERRTPTVRRATPLRTAAFFLFAVTPDPLLTNAPRKPNTHSSTSDTSSNRCVLSFGGNARPSAHARTDSLLSHAASPSPLRHAPRRLFLFCTTQQQQHTKKKPRTTRTQHAIRRRLKTKTKNIRTEFVECVPSVVLVAAVPNGQKALHVQTTQYAETLDHNSCADAKL